MKGIKISKPNNSLTNSSDTQLDFTSEGNEFKIVEQGAITFPGSTTRSTPHGQDKIPAFLALKKNAADSFYIWPSVNNYINKTVLSLQGSTANDRISYVILADRGGGV